jgi:hypothetical protein
MSMEEMEGPMSEAPVTPAVSPLKIAGVDLEQLLRDAAELRSAYGFLTMRLAVAEDAQDSYDICKREWGNHEAAFTRTEPLLVNVEFMIQRLRAALSTPAPQPETEQETTNARRKDTPAESEGREMPEVSREIGVGHRAVRGNDLLLSEVSEGREVAANRAGEGRLSAAEVAGAAPRREDAPPHEHNFGRFDVARLAYVCPCGEQLSTDLVLNLAEREHQRKGGARGSRDGPTWREIARDGYPEDGQRVLVWRRWPGDIRDTKFLNLRMPGPSWEGLYGWEPTHWMALPAAPGSEQ